MMDGNPLGNLFSHLMGHNRPPEIKYEPVAPLSKKDSEEWEKFSTDIEKAKSKISEIEAKKTLYWIKMERKLNIYNKNLKIENGVVYVETDTKNNCEHHSKKLPLPGFCSGDCDNCSLSSDKEEDPEL
jgi:hypothetical protein